jgi:hypothetical protein
MLGVRVGEGVKVIVAVSASSKVGVSVAVGTWVEVSVGDGNELVVVSVGNAVGWTAGRHPNNSSEIARNMAARLIVVGRVIMGAIILPCGKLTADFKVVRKLCPNKRNAGLSLALFCFL